MKKKRAYIKPDAHVAGSFKPFILSVSPTQDPRRDPDKGLNIYDLDEYDNRSIPEEAL